MRLVILSSDRGAFKGQHLPDGRKLGENYVLNMLKSLEDSGALERKEFLPIPIIVGTPAVEYLGRYNADPRFKIVPMPLQTANAWGVEDLHGQAGCALNYVQCWRYFLEQMKDCEQLLVLEDDITLARDWLPTLDQTLKSAYAAFPLPPLVTLYRPTDRLMGMYVRQGLTWYEISEPYRHWGMQGWVYHRSHFFDVSTLFQEISVKIIKKPKGKDVGILEWVFFDHLAKFERNKNKIKFVATCPSLVQHHGVGSLVGCGVHQSFYVLNENVFDVDASQGPVTVQVPMPTRPGENIYVRKMDATDHPVIVKSGEKELTQLTDRKPLELVAAPPPSPERTRIRRK